MTSFDEALGKIALQKAFVGWIVRIGQFAAQYIQFQQIIFDERIKMFFQFLEFFLSEWPIVFLRLIDDVFEFKEVIDLLKECAVGIFFLLLGGVNLLLEE